MRWFELSFLFQLPTVLIDQTPFINVEQRNQCSPQWRQEQFGVIVVVIELVLILLEHVLKKRNRPVSNGRTALYNKIFESLSVSRNQHRIDILQSFGSFAMRGTIFRGIFE